MALLGWSYDDQTEMMSREELVARFTLERVGKSAAVFDYEKLKHDERPLPARDAAAGVRRPARRVPTRAGLRVERRPRPPGRTARAGEDRDARRLPRFAGFLFARVEPEGKVDGAVLPAASEALAAVEPFEAEPIEAALRGVAGASASSRATRFSRSAWP